ncbi:MAG: gfo/Idh/MocA family oxidoreductase, partial [Bacteroidia bacterium]
MIKGGKLGRRDFLMKTAAASLAITVVPRHVLGGQGYTAPSDQLTKGIIGVGGMGRGHIPYEGTRVLAICDVDTKHLEAALAITGPGVDTYHDFRELLARPDIDIIHIAT